MDEDISHYIIIITITNEHGHIINDLNENTFPKENCWNAVAQFELQIFVCAKGRWQQINRIEQQKCGQYDAKRNWRPSQLKWTEANGLHNK